MRRAFGLAVFGAILLIGVVSGVHAQCADSLIVVAPAGVGENTTVHIPVYAHVCAHGDTGMTGMQIMFHNDSPGLSITAIEWDGPSIGEANTAINDHIVNPLTWSMNNAGPDYRGGTSVFNLMGTDPSIPSGHHLLCWLVVATTSSGDYVLEPADGYGDPPLANAFSFMLTPGYPVLVGDIVHVITALSISAPGDTTVDENEAFCFGVTALDVDPSHEMTLTMLDGPEGATFDPDPNVGYSSITSLFCWRPDYCMAGDHTATFQVTTSEDTVQWVTSIHVINVNREPGFVSSTPSCPVNVDPEIPLIIEVEFIDFDATLCGDDSLVLSFTGPGDSFVDHGDGTGTYTWTPTEADTGVHAVFFMADDQYGGHAERHCQITVGGEDQKFIRGDVQVDGDFDIFDGAHIFYWIGGDAPWPTCLDACDVQDDGDVDIYDGIHLYLWIGGDLGPPLPPYPSCGTDPTPDNVSCDAYPPCGFPGAQSSQ